MVVKHQRHTTNKARQTSVSRARVVPRAVNAHMPVEKARDNESKKRKGTHHLLSG